jgi:predicted nucleic acid-binding protein
MPANFFDSNVILYLFDSQNPDKQRRAETLVLEAIAKKTGVISFQVVQECLNILVGKLGMKEAEAAELCSKVLYPLWDLMPSHSLYLQALRIKTRYAFGFFDSVGAHTRVFKHGLAPT